MLYAQSWGEVISVLEEMIKLVIAHSEQVFPRVKEKCTSKDWFAYEDIMALEELIAVYLNLRV
ncbi:Magnesium transporter CorA-like family protein [Perilla frutescens var. frutescens]|nr:Magnesium transporter CorA-like family protein [Perilla frutescens var. frutescens]